MLSKILRTLYGNITPEEVEKFSLLSAIFFFTIGTYWLLRPLKDDLFNQLVGIDLQPRAKIFSGLVVVPLLVLVYSKLVDIFEKHHLFYVIGGAYALLFFFITMLIGHPTIGLANTVAGPHRWLGWLEYFAVESFGSIIVALFWSFVASITEAQSAKRGYSLVIGGAQLGSIMGTGFATFYARSLGLRAMFLVASFGVLAMMLMVRYFMRAVPASYLVGDKTAAAHEGEKKKTGFFEGIRLILSKPYIFGILIVATLYEVIATIVDFQMKKLAAGLPQYQAPGALAGFLGFFGLCVNTLALVMALLGTSYMMRRYGLTFCLLAFPVSLGAAVTYLWWVAKYAAPSPEVLMWTAFFVMIIAKGLSYALNNPSKEMMYIPTSKDVKFKAKGWIDMFGNRLAKAGGSEINDFLKLAATPVLIVQSGAIISLVIVAVWVFAATYVGRMFGKLTTEGKIVE